MISSRVHIRVSETVSKGFILRKVKVVSVPHHSEKDHDRRKNMCSRFGKERSCSDYQRSHSSSRGHLNDGIYYSSMIHRKYTTIPSSKYWSYQGHAALNEVHSMMIEACELRPIG